MELKKRLLPNQFFLIIIRHIKTTSILILLVISIATAGCSINQLVIREVANILSGEGSSVFISDDDPELVSDALPFALKLYESLLEGDPDNRELLLATGRAFTLYANAFVQTPAEMLPSSEFEKQQASLDRAKKLYLRARGYIFRGIEVKYTGFGDLVENGDVDAAITLIDPQDVAYLYWGGASWIGAIAAGQFDLSLAVDLPKTIALLSKVIEWDESYYDGGAHDIFISYYGSLPSSLGGSEERARYHFNQSIQLSKGLKTTPYLALATSLSVKNQDVEEFKSLLNTALEIDSAQHPNYKLVNTINRRKAKWLLDNIEEYFLLEGEEE